MMLEDNELFLEKIIASLVTELPAIFYAIPIQIRALHGGNWQP